MTRPLQPFHLAVPVHDLAACRAFYGQLMGCPEGRHSDRWVDFNFFGHQLVIHQIDRPGSGPDGDAAGVAGRNAVDGDAVPVPHFGVVLAWDDFHALTSRLAAADVAFEIPPRIRFAGEVGEQATCFLFDPSGNALEFKAFRDISKLFAPDL